MDRAEKRAYLSRYNESKKTVKLLQTKYKELAELAQTVPTARVDACKVNKSGHSDQTGDNGVKLADLKTKIYQAMDISLDLYQETQAIFNQKKNGYYILSADEAEALALVYLDGKTVSEAAKNMGKSASSMHHFIAEALDKIEIVNEIVKN